MNHAISLRLLTTFIALLAASAAECGHQSMDVFEARAYRVDQASGQQSEADPVDDYSWDFGEAIPYSERQADLFLHADDELAVWFPSAASATSLGGPSTYMESMPQVDMLTHTVTFDRYHRLESVLSAHAVAGAVESGYWFGALPTGEYVFELNDWTLPGVESDPLAGLFGPPSLTTPWSLDIPQATIASSMSWRFSVIPEPAAGLLGLIGLTIAALRRR